MPPTAPQSCLPALALLSLLLCSGCGVKQPKPVPSTPSNNRTPIFDLIASAPVYSNAILAADQDLPGDNWITNPFRLNVSRSNRVAPIAKKILEDVRPKLKQMSVIELAHCLKVENGTGYDGYIADPLYAEGNDMIISEIKSRPAQERQALLGLPYDRADLETGIQGPPVTMDELVRGLVTNPSENPPNVQLRDQFVGVWARDNTFVTMTVDGGFVSRSIFPAKNVTYEGKWTLQDGSLITTITNCAAQGTTNVQPLGTVTHFVINRIDHNSMVLSNDGQTLTFKRGK